VQELRSVAIDSRLLDPNEKALLEDTITAAVNAALTQSREYMQKELNKVTGGVKIPGLT